MIAHLNLWASSPASMSFIDSELKLVQNKGQWDEHIRFRADLAIGKLYLEDTAFTFQFHDPLYHQQHSCATHQACSATHTVDMFAYRMTFPGADIESYSLGSAEWPFYHNYFLGNDSSRWASNVKVFNRAHYMDIYPGIDLKIKGDGDNLKYDVIIEAGADPSQFKVRYEGIDALDIRKGNLVYSTPFAEVTELAPYAYQIIDQELKEVPCKYALNGNELHFEFPKGYDQNFELVIDPTLVFASYSGSTGDNFGYTATYDSDGNLYAGSIALEPGYPTTPGAYQGSFAGGNPNGNGINADMAISKFNAQGTNLLYSTYIGGIDNDQPQSMIVKNNNELYICGRSYSTNYPVSIGCFDNTINGQSDIVISKLSANGTAMLASTFVGGSGNDGVNISENASSTSSLKFNYADDARGEIILDANGNVLVASSTQSPNFPTSVGAPQRTFGGGQDGCAFRMNPGLTTLDWSTLIGGSASDAAYSIKPSPNGDIYVCGGTVSSNLPTTPGALQGTFAGGRADGYIARINQTGTAFSALTYTGTADYDQCYFVEIDEGGEVYVYGQTSGPYPVSPGVYSNNGGSQFIHKLNSDLTQTVFSTVFGSGTSRPNISPTAFLVDKCENIYISGWGGNVNQSVNSQTGNTNGMPLTPDAFKSNTDGSDFYFLVLERDAAGLLFGSYYGGNSSLSSGEHVDGGTSRFDREGVIYQAICAGCGGNSFFPTTTGVWSPGNRSSNCNLGALKIEFDLSGTDVDLTAVPAVTGCVPLRVNFQSTLRKVRQVFWDFGDGNTSTQLNPTHIYTDTGTFQVMLVGIDSSSCNIADTAYETIIVRDDSVSARFLNLTAIDCSTRTVSFATGTNSNNPSFSWDFGDGNSSSSPTPTHTYAQPGTYNITLRVTDPTSCNSQDVRSATITIPDFEFLDVAISDTIGCYPLAVNFQNNSNSNGSYAWDFGNGTTSQLRSPSFTFTQPGVYPIQVTLTDSNSCNINDTFTSTITVIDSHASADFDVARTFYGCDSMRLDVWSLYPDADGHFWDFGDGNGSTDSVASNTYLPGIYTLQYIVLDSSQICKPLDTAEITIYVVSLEAGFVPSDTGGCIPLGVQFNNVTNIPAANYLWDFGDGGSSTDSTPFHTFTYVDTFEVVLVVTDSSICNFSDTFRSEIKTRDDFVIAAFNQTILQDCDSVLEVDFSNLSQFASEYRWDFGDGTTSIQTNPSHTYTLPGTYQVRLIAIDTNRCHPFDTAFTTLRLKPNTRFDFEIEEVACDGDLIRVVNRGNLNASYTWDFGDGTILTGPTPSHRYSQEGQYTITVYLEDTSTCNVFDTASAQIQVYSHPISGFSTDTNYYEWSEPVAFFNESSNYERLVWYFGDGDSLAGVEDPVHQYFVIGDVQPCIITYNSPANCADTFCIDLEIWFEAALGVPNAFSPNDDGVNDVHFVEGKGITSMDIKIFNRWGQMVFRSTDQKIGWDGRFNGKDQEVEVYVYTINVEFVDGTTMNRTGNITLLR